MEVTKELGVIRFRLKRNTFVYYTPRMAKLVRSYRVSEEVDTLLKAESARLTEANGGKPKVSEADVIELSVVRYLSEPTGGTEPLDGWEVPVAQQEISRRAAAETAMREIEAKPPSVEPPPKVNKRSESVAQRKAREAKERAAELAESDTVARMVGRDDIEYDLENTPHRSVIHGAGNVLQPTEKPHYEVQPRKVKPLSRPHGNTEPKRRREQ